MNNKEIVVDYLNIVFNERDLIKAETYWAGDMIQHNPGMPNGLEVLRGFIGSPDPSPTYEAGVAMEDGDLVMVHGRYTNWFGKNMIAVDIFRLQNGKVVEHWDVMQEEVPADKSANGNAMFPIN
ncbi:nuclear transport factor 2 family protein [Achromobacter xylosoxidans]